VRQIFIDNQNAERGLIFRRIAIFVNKERKKIFTEITFLYKY